MQVIAAPRNVAAVQQPAVLTYPCHLELPLPQLAAWGPAVCGRDRVVSALYSLFAAFAAEEQQRQQAGPLQGTTPRRGLVNPSELRQALSALPGPKQYRVGECAMNGWAGLLTLAACSMGGLLQGV